MNLILVFLFLAYIVISVASMPALTRQSYKNKKVRKEVRNTYISSAQNLIMQREAACAGFWAAFLWPILLPIVVNAKKLEKALEKEKQKAIEKANAERILKECAPELEWSGAFKKAEEEATSKQLVNLEEKIDKLPTSLNLENFTYNDNATKIWFQREWVCPKFLDDPGYCKNNDCYYCVFNAEN